MVSKSMALIVGAVLVAAVAARHGEPPRVATSPVFSESLRINEALPPGHPPIAGWGLPEGHPPVGQAYPGLPEGHPPVPWAMPECPGMQGFDGTPYDADAAPDSSAPEIIST
jgi:hypothetical protein